VAVGFAVHKLQVDLCVARVCQWTCSECQRAGCCSSHVYAARALCVPSLWPDGPTSVVVHLAWAQLLQQLWLVAVHSHVPVQWRCCAKQLLPLGSCMASGTTLYTALIVHHAQHVAGGCRVLAWWARLHAWGSVGTCRLLYSCFHDDAPRQRSGFSFELLWWRLWAAISTHSSSGCVGLEHPHSMGMGWATGLPLTPFDRRGPANMGHFVAPG